MWQQAAGAARGGGKGGGKGGKSFKSTASRVKTVNALGKLAGGGGGGNSVKPSKPNAGLSEPVNWQGLTNNLQNLQNLQNQQNQEQLRDDLQINVPSTTAPPAPRSQPESWDISYLKVEFDDIIAEPAGTRSPDFVWTKAQSIYKSTKNQCYSLLTMLFALPLTVFFAITVAIVQFQHVWCFVPAVKHCRIGCHVVKQYVGEACGACLEPLCLSLGVFFSRIKITGDSNGKPRQFV